MRFSACIGAGVLLTSFAAMGETYQVGPTRSFTTLGDALSSLDLEPGDVVEIDGDTIYPDVRVRSGDGGSAQNPVILRGISINGNPPHFRGGDNTINNDASHIVYENIEISGTGNVSNGTFRCFFHKGTGVVLRGVHVHDCPNHGIQSADSGSGSLTVEYSRVINVGSGSTRHALYIATDEVNFPGSVFRLQYSYVRDTQFDNSDLGGNMIKSRAERNEIYYNWLEGAYFHTIELIGPDPAGAPSGYSEGLVREDSDVVGNIIVHTEPDFDKIIRLGGDGTGQTYGRFRFVNNTVINRNGDFSTVFRLFDGIESLEANNNVFWNQNGGSGLRIIRENEADWESGSTTIVGTNNWIEDGSSFIPQGFSDSVFGANPGFVNAAGRDYTPSQSSALIDRGGPPSTGEPGFQISTPLVEPVRHPPQEDDITVGVPATRPDDEVIDIGALEVIDLSIIFQDGFEIIL
ncbi:MAG: hypothetical protein QNJ40_21690 [Xanthomonadales bacterium]|nr:hypothetical protein [Xanthomonadales bacterium]